MELTIDLAHPLAQAIFNAGASDTWLLLKTPSEDPFKSYQSTFRAGVKRYWVKNTNDVGVLHVDLETWEEYTEHKALMSGL